MDLTRVIAATLGIGAVTVLSACEPAATTGNDPAFVLNGTELVSIDGGAVETGVASDPAQQSLAASCPADPTAAGVLANAINSARNVEGKVLLNGSEKLTQIAQSHACDMVRMNSATVAGSNGSSVVDRARAVEYPTCGVIQMAQVGGSPGGVVMAWLASPPHREQVLGQLSDDIGVGVATGADGRQWWSVVIGDNCR